MCQLPHNYINFTWNVQTRASSFTLQGQKLNVLSLGQSVCVTGLNRFHISFPILPFYLLHTILIKSNHVKDIAMILHKVSRCLWIKKMVTKLGLYRQYQKEGCSITKCVFISYALYLVSTESVLHN